jgi:hypothetical protein
MNLGVASIIDIGFPGGPSNNYPSWLDGLILALQRLVFGKLQWIGCHYGHEIRMFARDRQKNAVWQNVKQL